MTPAQLTTLIRTAPRTPGVYRFLHGKKPLYIGKATQLRSRLASYARAGDPRIAYMVSQATKVTWEELQSPIEALIEEARLIKKLKPHYNIVMRDDKQYLFVEITEEAFPRIIVTHQPSRADALGPFTDSGALKQTLRILRTLFPYCTCTQKHYVRCLNAHIGKCLGVCCLRETDGVDTKPYRRNIQSIVGILSGKRTSVLATLTRTMKRAAKAGALEDALALQKTIDHMERIFAHAQIHARLQPVAHSDALAALQKTLRLPKPPVRIEGYDIAHMQGAYATGSLVVFKEGAPCKNAYRKFRIHASGKPDDTAMLTEVLTRRLAHRPGVARGANAWELPDCIVVDGGKAQYNAVRAVLEKQGLTIPVIAFTKDERHVGSHLTTSRGVLPLPTLPRDVQTLVSHIDNEAHRFAIQYYRSLHLKGQRG
ncbi:MAG: GIY-YIG nuclease family protein [Patescibacteria group bacterium]